MIRSSHVVISRSTARLARRLARPFSKRKLFRATRVMWPALAALTVTSIAQAQGTMDFSGAQTLMGTFKTFAIYAGAVICFGGLIFAGIRRCRVAFRTRSQDSSARCLVPEFSVGELVGSDP
jgi:hypothetical protein